MNGDALLPVKAADDTRLPARAEDCNAMPAGSAKRVLCRISDLIEAVDQLLASKTAKNFIEVVQDLNCGNVINSAMDGLSTPVDQADRLIQEQVRPWVVQLEAVSGLLGLAQPLVRGAGRLTDASLDVAAIGLSESQLAPVRGAVNEVADRGALFLQYGEAFLDGFPAGDDLDRLSKEMQTLKQTLTGFKRQVGANG